MIRAATANSPIPRTVDTVVVDQVPPRQISVAADQAVLHDALGGLRRVRVPILIESRSGHVQPSRRS